jgi:hypothetical protein
MNCLLRDEHRHLLVTLRAPVVHDSGHGKPRGKIETDISITLSLCVLGIFLDFIYIHN